jgi:multiple antibiotic resistance protein
MDDLRFALVALSAIFVVVDPIAAMPVFLSVTANDPLPKRRAMAARTAWACFVILTVFALGGGLIFRLFGISLGSFKIAGGLMLVLTAMDMMRAQPSRTRSTTEEESEGVSKDDVAVIPMAIPVLAGPGAIATDMVLMSQTGWRPVPVLCLLGAITVTAIAVWLLLRAATLANRLISETTVRVFGRIMGLVLAAIAVEFVVGGLHDLFPALGSPPPPP